jgi:hypothetical protein
VRESGYVNPLEQSCIGPGHWYIEGYRVIRRTGLRARKWSSEWHITFNRDDEPVIRRTLGEARDWIRDQIEARRSR